MKNKSKSLSELANELEIITLRLSDLRENFLKFENWHCKKAKELLDDREDDSGKYEHENENKN